MEQMELFNEGGLRDEGGAVEPESGNEVPSGALKKEVADDIPVMISEGEFVFPADVVRYIGLETLMKMRQDAKQGLKMMEKMGQMGNSEEATVPDDVPFGMADLIVVSGEMKKKDKEEKAEGGVIGLQTGGSLFDDPRFQRPEGGDNTPVLSDEDKEEIQDALSGTAFGSLTMRRYVNADGVVKYIPFIDDEPQMEIPEGFELDNSAPTPQSSVVSQTVDTDRGEDSGGATFIPDTGSALNNQGSASFNINNLDSEELVEYYGSFSSSMNRFLPVGVGALFGGVPALAIAAMQQLAQTRGPNSLLAVENLIAEKIARGEISGELLDRLKEYQERAAKKGTSPKGFLANLIGKISGGDEAKKSNLEKAIAGGDVGAVNDNLTEVDRENFKTIDVSPAEAVPSKFVEEIEADVFGPAITAEEQPETDTGAEDPFGSAAFADEFTGTGRTDPAEVERLEREKRAKADFEFLGGDYDLPDLMDKEFDALEMEIVDYSKGSPYETEGRRQLGTPTKDMPLKTRKRTERTERTERTDRPDPFRIPRRGEKMEDTPSLFGQTRVDDFLMGVQRDDKGNVTNLDEQQQENIQKNVKRQKDIKKKIDKEEKDRMSRGFGPMSVQERFDREQEEFTGFDSSGNMSDPFDEVVNVGGRLVSMYVGGVPTKPMKPQRLKKGGLAKPKVKPKRMKKGGLASKKK